MALTKTCGLTDKHNTLHTGTASLIFCNLRKPACINSIVWYLYFQVHHITRHPSTYNTNSMMAVRALYGRWEFFWWICCHQVNRHLNIKVMLFACSLESLTICHQVLHLSSLLIWTYFIEHRLCLYHLITSKHTEQFDSSPRTATTRTFRRASTSVIVNNSPDVFALT